MHEATAFAASATLVALAFAACTWERWLRRRRRHDLAWSAAMVLFAGGAAAFWSATGGGWTTWNFRLFYVLGGVLTVPVLALGTVYLLAGQRIGDRVAAIVALIGAYATGVVFTEPLRRGLDPARLNEGRELFGLGPRLFAAVGSGLGASVVIGGALWSALSLARAGRRPGSAARSRPGASPARLAASNVAIAVGTLLISFKRPFVQLTGSDETGFAVALTLGLAVIFVGFLLASTRGRTRPEPISPSVRAEDPRSEANRREARTPVSRS